MTNIFINFKKDREREKHERGRCAEIRDSLNLDYISAFPFQTSFFSPPKNHMHNQQQTGTQWIKAHLKLVISDVLDLLCRLDRKHNIKKNPFKSLKHISKSQIFHYTKSIIEYQRRQGEVSKMEACVNGKLWKSATICVEDVTLAPNQIKHAETSFISIKKKKKSPTMWTNEQ